MPAYGPARLVQGSDRWYVLFYALNENGERQRYRPTFNLNLIKDLTLRKERGETLVEKINWWLSGGNDAWLFEELSRVPSIEKKTKKPHDELEETPVVDAIDFIVKLKSQTTRKDSARSYKSIGSLFVDFITAKRWTQLSIVKLTRRHAAAYMDHCLVDRQVGNRTYNNNLRMMRAMFSDLVERGYINKNPFQEIRFKPEEPKKRRRFSSQEAKIVIRKIRQESPLLFNALLFEYCCFIRPSEIRHLKFEDIDLEMGVVRITQATGKTKMERHATIPDDFRGHFNKGWFRQFPFHWYVFGKAFRPHPNKTCGRNTMNKKHRTILEKLYAAKELSSIEGLQWYSWKDTGITDALSDIPLIGVQDQAGHSSPEMTLKYRHKNKVNEHMKGFKNRII